MRTADKDATPPNVPAAQPWVLFIKAAVDEFWLEEFRAFDACSQFYGLRIESCQPDTLPDTVAWTERPVAVVLSAMVCGPALTGFLAGPIHGVPILLFGVDTHTDQASLQAVTEGRVRAGATWHGTLPVSVRICANRALAGALVGQNIPTPAKKFSRLELAADADGCVATWIGSNENDPVPCVARWTLPRGETWVSARATGQSDGWYFEREHFSRHPHLLVLAALFLRSAGGDRCWQSPAPFANLCIDDPRLTEPYGRMSYPALLAEAQRANFHATIGFIPWNYDRNVPSVVDLVRRHPRWLSLAVHGNNHDRFEFYGPRRWREDDPWQVKSLAEQETALRQALLRMEELSRSTGLSYDRVMVFPHAIGSMGTLRLLKHWGFTGTANYNNFPLGASPPSDLATCLSTVNSNGFGFPAVRRDYPKNRAEWTVAFDLFLGNPVLFMAHEDLFSGGIDAFNTTAALVARLEPAVRWTGLGELFQGLYRQRRLPEGTWEIEMCSDEVDVKSPDAVPCRCLVYRQDPHDPAVEALAVDGSKTPTECQGATVMVALDLSPGEIRRITVLRRKNDRPTPPLGLRRRGIRHRALRGVAEFRDLWMSGTTAGRWLTRLYYAKKLHRIRWQGPRRLARIILGGLKAVSGGTRRESSRNHR